MVLEAFTRHKAGAGQRAREWGEVQAGEAVGAGVWARVEVGVEMAWALWLSQGWVIGY